jgi:hypothetical protein
LVIFQTCGFWVSGYRVVLGLKILKEQIMDTTLATEVLEKRMRSIALLAEDINDMYREGTLSIKQKYEESLFFIHEMLRSVTGLTDQDEEVMTYEWWK